MDSVDLHQYLSSFEIFPDQIKITPSKPDIDITNYINKPPCPKPQELAFSYVTSKKEFVSKDSRIPESISTLIPFLTLKPSICISIEGNHLSSHGQDENTKNDFIVKIPFTDLISEEVSLQLPPNTDFVTSEELLEAFKSSKSSMKQLIIHKKVSIPFNEKIDSLIMDLLAGLGYHRNRSVIRINWELYGSKFRVHPPGFVSHGLRTNTCDIISIITCMWPFFFPIRKCIGSKFELIAKYTPSVDPSTFLNRLIERFYHFTFYFQHGRGMMNLPWTNFSGREIKVDWNQHLQLSKKDMEKRVRDIQQRGAPTPFQWDERISDIFVKDDNLIWID